MPKTQAPKIKNDLPVSPDEAADILSVAVRYCQRAGLNIRYVEKDGLLWLSFPGLSIVPLVPGKQVEIVAKNNPNGTAGPADNPNASPENPNGTPDNLERQE